MIIFYNFDYELEILKGLYYGKNVSIAEWNGHAHNPVPKLKDGYILCSIRPAVRAGTV